MSASPVAVGIEAAWRGFRRRDFPWESWAVEDRTLHALPGTPRVDLVSRERYQDFTLTLEWRLARGGDTGILHHVREDVDEAWQSGPEMQLLDDAHHPDGEVAERSCGALCGLIAPFERLGIDPSVRFHTARLAMREGLLEHWIDEHRVLGCDVRSKLVLGLIATSRFRTFPRFANERDGHIVLQHCGDEAWFRHIRIRRL